MPARDTVSGPHGVGAKFQTVWTHTRNGVGHTFRALESRNFRLFLSGQWVSLVGTWMQQLAMSWLVYHLTGSVFLLGLIAFLGQGPGFFITPFAGMLADRVNRRRALAITQSLSMVQAFLLAYLSLTGQIQVWQVVILSIMGGVITSIETPIRQAFVVELLDKPQDLGNAISLNSSAFNASRLVGPSVAGFAIATVGEGWCFCLNGISYLAVIVALLNLRLSPKKSATASMGYLQGISEGFSYAYKVPPIRNILALVALVSLVGLPYSTLMPVYVKDVLHRGADTLGYLMGMAGAGALTGAIFLATRTQPLSLERFIPVSAALLGTSLLGFATLSIMGLSSFWPSLGLMYLVGLGMMMQLASSNIILQTWVADHMRGRVMSLYAMSFMGMTPFGSLLLGTLAQRLGVPLSLGLGGFICLVGAGGFAWRRQYHQERLATFLQTSKTSHPEPNNSPSETQDLPAVRRWETAQPISQTSVS